MFTMSAFYFGETLQAKTTSTRSEAAKKVALSCSSASITVSDAPATMIPCVLTSWACLPLLLAAVF